MIVLSLARDDLLRGVLQGRVSQHVSLPIIFVFCFCLLVRAHNSCDWHAVNDIDPDFAHYDAHHDGDGNGFGCESITGEDTGVETTITLIELDETGSFIEESPAASTDPTPETSAPAVPSVELLANSNFRRGPGLAFAIVGGGASGSIYQWTQAQYGNGGYIWYELILPAGAGWVRGDLIRLLDAPPASSP